MPTDLPPRIQNALALSESEKLDFKRVVSVSSAVKSAIAMANTTGGWLVLGLEDPKKASGTDRLYGLEENPEALGEFQKLLKTRVIPPLTPPSLPHEVKIEEIACVLRNGLPGHIALVTIPSSNAVHSAAEGPTYIRIKGPADQQIGAAEIVELSLRRGVRTAVDELCDVDVALLETSWWRDYAGQRRLSRPLAEALPHLGLVAKKADGAPLPKQAAVLLFAEHPGALLGIKAAIRIFHYRGHQVEHGPNTNLQRPPVTVDGPLLHQIRESTRLVLDELYRAGGTQVTIAGFTVAQRYPDRVIQEAITNAVLHRDYRIQQDIHIRLFANRIEIESPGGFPGAVTVDNIGQIGSRPRNRVLVDHLREFPVPPNLDAGEGVPMMQATLSQAGLFPPMYRLITHTDREAVLVILRNEARNDDWEMVKDYLKTKGSLSNADLRQILNLSDRQVDKASRMLGAWTADGDLVILNPDEGSRKRRYGLPNAEPKDLGELLALLASSASKQAPIKL